MLGKNDKAQRKNLWMTNEILALVKVRRKHNKTKNRKIKAQFQKKESKHNSFNVR